MQAARQKITVLLEQAIGLKASAIGISTLERAVHSRMRATNSRDIDAYLDRLTSSLLEMRRLVEEVVVPETWFFRDQDPFIFLSDYIQQAGKDLGRDLFRILSLPCSTGEEPYSIAMTLLLAGLPASAFYIDAVDVSERVLERARQGIYRDNSFRSKDLSFRDIFFTRSDDGYVLRKAVRDKVRFLQGNLIQSGFMESLGRYDVVFCRNVLIYFNEEAQRQAIASLHHVLLTGGILFTGHAEASLLFNSKLFTVAHAKAFAFQRPQLQTGKRQPEENNQDTQLPAQPPRRPAPPAVQQAKTFSPPAATVSRQQEKPEFTQVRRLADAGQLEEAARRSEEHLRLHGPEAEWYYLLGIIRDSLGQQEEALKLLRKAVYLDPGNVESLIHLALLAERTGDLDGAANYRRRARKFQEEGTDMHQERT